MARKILVTNALPYANGRCHIGHLVGYLQADMWVRFQRLVGNECHYICGSDTHGTAVMIAAQQKGVSPEALIQELGAEWEKTFAKFQIQFDRYGSTHDASNAKLCGEIYEKLKLGGHIARAPVEQTYCEHDKMFLPDRYVKGECPNCGAKDQYGDSCDVCGATYAGSELKNPYCSICGNTPVRKTTEHVLFRLENFRQFLTDWLPKHTSPEVHNKMFEWFDGELRDWDISRDAPYFGFAIPGEVDKYFYVWVDAPVGYASIFKDYCAERGLDFASYWSPSAEPNTELYHFIGKDIARFHTLFWPAMLHGAGLRTPTQVFVHGYLTVNGMKMSKSKGTQIEAEQLVKLIPSDFVRYYYATKMAASLDDVDINLAELPQRINAELVGKLTNLASRGATMLEKNFAATLTNLDAEGEALLRLVDEGGERFKKHFEARDFAQAMVVVRDLADETNRYFDRVAPWKLIKENPQAVASCLTTTLNAFRAMVVWLSPVMPTYAEKVRTELFLETKAWTWSSSQQRLTRQTIASYQHLATRLEAGVADQLLQNTQPEQGAKVTDPAKNQSAKATEDRGAAKNEASIEVFNQIDLRVALVVSAESIAEADKLIRLKVSLGPMGERQIIAGMKAAYPDPAVLIGKKIVVVANLPKRKMKFGESEGMALAAGAGGSQLCFLFPGEEAAPGDPVK